MRVKNLESDLKQLIQELKEEESIATQSHNHLHANGLAQARVSIETLIEKHGMTRPRTIELCRTELIN